MRNARVSRLTPLVNEFMHKRRVVEVMMDFVLIGSAYYLANRWRYDVETYAAPQKPTLKDPKAFTLIGTDASFSVR